MVFRATLLHIHLLSKTNENIRKTAPTGTTPWVAPASRRLSSGRLAASVDTSNSKLRSRPIARGLTLRRERPLDSRRDAGAT